MAETIDHYTLERSKDQKTTWQTVNPDATSPFDDPSPDGNPATAQDNTVFYRVTGITTPGNLEVPYDIGSLSLNPPGRCLGAVGTRGVGVGAYHCLNKGMTKDSSGNLNVLFSIQGNQSVNFATPGQSQVLISSAGGAGVIASYTQDRVLRWAKKTADGFAVFAITTDSTGASIVTGKATGTGGPPRTSNFGNDYQGSPVVIQNNVDGVGNYWGDIIVAKYRGSDGALLWAKKFATDQEDNGTALCCDSSDNIFLTGYTDGSSIVFDSITLSGPGVIRAKLNSSGVTQWAKISTKGLGTTTRSYGMTLNAFGDLFICGFAQSNDLNPGGGVLATAGMWLARYNSSDGNYDGNSWQKNFSGDARAVACTTTGHVIMTGYVGGPVNFGNGTTIGPGIFFAIYNRSGVCQSSRCANHPALGNSEADKGLAISVDAGGDIAFSGNAYSTLSFDGSAGWYGPVGFFVAVYSSDLATLRWARRTNQTGQQPGQTRGTGQGASSGVCFNGHTVAMSASLTRGTVYFDAFTGSNVMIDSNQDGFENTVGALATYQR